MSDGEDGAFGELFEYGLLNDLVGVVVDRGGRFVEDENACLAEKRPR